MEALTPKKYSEIQPCLGRLTKDSKILGGGTDYIIRLNGGTANPDILCYLGHVEELKSITIKEDGITIGAYATMTELENHPVIRQHFPALMHAASDVGSLQIRNCGTIGGNIGNASPAGDLIPVLYLYQAVIEVLGPEGSRMIPISEIIERPGKTVLSCQEVIVKIHMVYPSFKSSFVKLGTRKTVTISRIGVALGLTLCRDQVAEIHIYIGAISIKPVTLLKAEQFLMGKPLNEQNILMAAEYLSQLILEITPKEFDRDYKVYSSKGVMMDVFKKLDR